MSKVVIRKKICIPSIGTWCWSGPDYKKPLVFPLAGTEARLYLDVWNPGSQRREITSWAVLEFYFDPAPRKILRGLTTSGKQAKEVAYTIYGFYLQVNMQFESLLYIVGRTWNLLNEKPIPLTKFFSDYSSHQSPYGDAVTFQIDKGPERKFIPRLSSGRRSLNPLFKRDQLIDLDKWRRMQEVINIQDFPSPEIIELFRIRSRLEWRQKKVATIEAAVFAETTLRNFITRVLIARGISKTKLKDLENDLSFSILLNALLPMTIPPTKAKKLRQYIVSVDVLRKLRNDVVHGNITETQIDEDKVRKGIEGTLRIVEVIKSII